MTSYVVIVLGVYDPVGARSWILKSMVEPSP
jgi:hypothetical protein